MKVNIMDKIRKIRRDVLWRAFGKAMKNTCIVVVAISILSLVTFGLFKLVEISVTTTVGIVLTAIFLFVIWMHYDYEMLDEKYG